MTYKRNCPNCNDEIIYATKTSLNRASQLQRWCRSCISIKVNEKKKIKEFVRDCPKCGKKLQYGSYHTWWWATKKTNQPCVQCAGILKRGKKMPVGFSEKISKIVSGKGNPMYGKRHTEEVKQFISKLNKGNKSKSGQTTSDATRGKMREAAVKRISKYGIHSRNFNPNGCKFMDSIRTEYEFQHALNGGEFSHAGYFADGYDKSKNVWFEYDEPHHFDFDGNLLKKDIDRMNIIKESLGCKVLRYNEKTKEWKWY